MEIKYKQVLENAFYQLLVIYTILILLASLNLFWKFSLQFQIFALILGFLGIIVVNKVDISKPVKDKKDKETKETYYKYLTLKNYFYPLLFLALFLIILFRIIPYINNPIPLGYDTGIYKYAVEHGLTNLDNWVLRSVEPGFLYLMSIFKPILSTHSILTYLLIFFSLILGLAVYLVASEFFGKEVGLIAIFIYALSFAQFLTFTYMYYKNIIALSLALFSIYYLKKYDSTRNKWFLFLFILLGGLTGAIHRPTFYIYGLSYFFYAFISPYNKKYDYKLMLHNILYGIIILAIAGIFYIGIFSPSITQIIEPVLQGFVQTGESPGTFINFFTYQFSTLTYLPFAILGFFYLIRKRKFNMLFFWTLITTIIVYFQFFFFNRFIIHLDIMLIILASLGFFIIIKDNKKLGLIILILMLFSSAFVLLKEARDTKPLINDAELNTIQYLSTLESNAYVMTTSSVYSPWVLGYSDRKTIAPGLFDYDKHIESEWNDFWKTTDINKIKQFMDSYQKPLYIFIGEKQNDNLKDLKQCFNLTYNNGNNKVYQYLC